MNPDSPGDTDDEQPPDPAEELDLSDRTGGVLSRNDVLYLLQDDPAFPNLDVEVGDENQKRWRIRQKVKTALSDFPLLEDLPTSEKELILDGVLGESVDPEDLEQLDIRALPDGYPRLAIFGEQYDHLQAVMGFLYDACNLTPGLELEHLVEDTVRQKLLEPNLIYETDAPGDRVVTDLDVNATITVDVTSYYQPDVDEIEEKLARGEGLSRQEVGELFLQGRLEPGDLSADDLHESVFAGGAGSDGFEGLEPSVRSPPEGWRDDLKEKLLDDQVEAVDWEAALRPEDVLAQLEEIEDDPYGRAMFDDE